MRTLALVIPLAACNGEHDRTAGAPPLTFATYNAGLAVGFVPGANSRAPLAADAVAALDADVVCLEEVWLPEHVAALDTAAASTFPNRFFPEPRQATDLGCAAGALDPLVGCLEASCDSTCEDEVVDCAFSTCAIYLLGLSLDCMRCAFASVGEDPTAARQACESDPIAFAYDGSFGTAILSKHPLGTVEELVFESTTNRRSALHAELDVEGGPVDVFCTHLSAVFDDIPYPRSTGSWQDEQLVQVDALNAWVDEVAGEHRVLLGDLNTGPGLEGIRAEAPDGYEKLVDAGWTSPYVDLDGRCTFCSENPLVASPDDDDDRIIDHVLVRGMDTDGAKATRILDGTVSADSCLVDLSTAALSDHYGVQVSIAP